MSGHFTEKDLARASELGCKLFTKPLDMDEIKNWIEEVERAIPLERVLFDWA
jgi:hypothetical protein